MSLTLLGLILIAAGVILAVATTAPYMWVLVALGAVAFIIGVARGQGL